jgi:hypothetical protein
LPLRASDTTLRLFVTYLDRDLEFVWTLKHLDKTNWQNQASATKTLFVAAATRTSIPQVNKRDDVIQKDQEEGHNERDAAKPREHKRAVAGAGGRL